MDFVLQTDLSVDYVSRPGVLRNVSLEISEGEIVGLVGQSGSGKTTLVMAMLGLLSESEARVRGSVVINGTDIQKMSERDLRHIRGRQVSLIPQNPVAALTPTLRIGGHFREAWLAHAKNWESEGLPRTRRLLKACALDWSDVFLQRFPDQISVGQAQRVLISMALLHDPVLVIADEPTSALDLITQREVLDLLTRINAEKRTSILLISHDLQAVASLCSTLAILHEGSIVECGSTQNVLSSPAHSYTKLLLDALPKLQISNVSTTK